jgi:hypothetical protein
MLHHCQTIIWYNNFTFAHYSFKFMVWFGTILHVSFPHRSQVSVISLSLGRKTKTVDLILGLPQVPFSQGMSSVSTQKLLSWRVSLNLYKRPVLCYFYLLKLLRILTVLKCKKIYISTFLINT